MDESCRGWVRYNFVTHKYTLDRSSEPATTVGHSATIGAYEYVLDCTAQTFTRYHKTERVWHTLASPPMEAIKRDQQLISLAGRVWMSQDDNWFRYEEPYDKWITCTQEHFAEAITGLAGTPEEASIVSTLQYGTHAGLACATAAMGTSLYVLDTGGRAVAAPTLRRYDTVRGTWTRLSNPPALPKEKTMFVLAQANDLLYWTNGLEWHVYNPSADLWATSDFTGVIAGDAVLRTTAASLTRLSTPSVWVLPPCAADGVPYQRMLLLPWSTAAEHMESDRALLFDPRKGTVTMTHVPPLADGSDAAVSYMYVADRRLLLVLRASFMADLPRHVWSLELTPQVLEAHAPADAAVSGSVAPVSVCEWKRFSMLPTIGVQTVPSLLAVRGAF